jgi:hypothetical protein
VVARAVVPASAAPKASSAQRRMPCAEVIGKCA